MKIRYVAIIAIIAVIIAYYIGNAFILQQQAVNKQSFYVHLQPEWQSYPRNLVYDVTNVWTSDGAQRVLDSQARLNLSKQANVDTVHSVHGKSYILVHHGNTECSDVWEPHYARFGADAIRHHIEYAMGVQKSPDPNINLYTPLESKQDPQEHATQIKTGYSQFIPVCTSREVTSFDYSIKINDENVGFDVYFVPSMDEQAAFDQGDAGFNYYTDGECSAKNYVRFSGTCHNVERNSGLLVAVPDNLNLPLTKIEVWFYEH